MRVFAIPRIRIIIIGTKQPRNTMRQAEGIIGHRYDAQTTNREVQ